MRLYLIRHADPAYPDDALSDAGHREARVLARRLAREGLDRLYTSPLARAAATARYAADELGLDPAVEPWTRELEDWWIPEGPEGEWPVWNVDGARIRADPSLAGEDWHHRPPFDAPHLAPAFAELCRASDAFLARHGCRREGPRYRVTVPGRERIGVVCHAGFALTWLAHLLALPPPLVWAGFYLAPSSVTTVLFEERTPEWAAPRCLAVGDVSHLYAAGLDPQPRGLVANFD